MVPIEMDDGADDTSVRAFTVLKQKLELDFSFSPRRVKGKTTIDIQPQVAHLRTIQLNCRQLMPTSVKVEGRVAHSNYSNLYQRLGLYPGTGIEQFHLPKKRLERHTSGEESELVITIPDRVKIKAVRPEDAIVDQDALASGFSTLGEGLYAPIKVEIEYVLKDFRDAVHFAGVEDGDGRYPHVYTRNSPFPGIASCFFPCVDDGITKCIFDIAIRYPRTMGDARSKERPAPAATNGNSQVNGAPKADSVMSDVDDDQDDMSEEEKAMEMSVICSGELTDDVRTLFRAFGFANKYRFRTLQTQLEKPPASPAQCQCSLSILAWPSGHSSTSTCLNTVTRPTTSDWAQMRLGYTPFAFRARQKKCATVP